MHCINFIQNTLKRPLYDINAQQAKATMAIFIYCAQKVDGFSTMCEKFKSNKKCLLICNAISLKYTQKTEMVDFTSIYCRFEEFTSWRKDLQLFVVW